MFNSIIKLIFGKKKCLQDASSHPVNVQQISPIQSTTSQKPDTALSKKSIRECPKQVNVNVGHTTNKLECITNCKTMTAKQLMLTYPHEYNSWRARKSWAKKFKVPFSPAFECFADFLSHHGPKSDPSLTLDRIVNSKGYVPGNTRWASKATQAENRKNVSHHKIMGDEIPQPAIARALNMSPDALRKRLARGDGVLDIIADRTGSNKHGKPNPKKPIWEWPWPQSHEDQFEIAYRNGRHGKESRVDFFVRYCQKQMQDLGWRFSGAGQLEGKDLKESQFWQGMLATALKTRQRAILESQTQILT